jgi:hypothetical protein
MNKPLQSLRFYKFSAAAMVLILGTAACLPVATTPVPTPVVQTVEVTREITQVVTQEVTREVTRIVEIPVTVTPTPTPTLTPTPSPTTTFTSTPTLTPAPQQARVTILDHIACWFGPADDYLIRYGLPATVWMYVKGRNQEGTWLLLEDGLHDNPCWIRTDQASFNGGGDINTYGIPVVSPDAILPIWTQLYRPPTGVQAFRSGNKVTVAWNGVWMTADDYEGYLIEAWLCKNGTLVFTPVQHKLPIEQNIEGDTQYQVLIDEPGCKEPSSARIYTVEKHGYTLFVKIPWPAY